MHFAYSRERRLFEDTMLKERRDVINVYTCIWSK